MRWLLPLAVGLSLASTAVLADSRETAGTARDRKAATTEQARLASKVIDLFECAALSLNQSDGKKARRYFAIALDSTRREAARDPESNAGLRALHPDPMSEDVGSVVGGYRAALGRLNASRNAPCVSPLGVRRPVCPGSEKRLDELGCERLAADLSR